ncbi:MAG: class I SAM-dependent methyltransferase [Proteobacteria bacterium]|nr:class I SAM-dependent methyltransferase [Pseudomonadota bacterium]
MRLCRLTSVLRRAFSPAGVALALAACMAPGQQAPEAAVLSPQRAAEIVASPDRSDADRVNDKRRKPQDMLMFIGVRPGMTALDLSAAAGYTTELIARAVGPTGRVYGQSAPRPPMSRPAQPEGAAQPPAADAPARPTGGPRPSPVALAERAKNPNAGNIIAVVRPFEDPAPPECASNCLDLVTLMFNYHDFGHMGVDRAATNRAVFAALKPGGMYVIADHSGRPGTGISEAGTLHRIEEAFLRAEVEQAGFKLVAQGNFLRNPSDPRDRNTPDPPQPKDEFVLKFVKP